MKFNLFLIATALLMFSSCKKEATEPYSIFQDNNYKTIKTQLVDVDLNSEYTLIIDSGYKSTNPVYSIQKNNEGEQIISSTSMVSKESHGWDGTESLNFEIVRVRLNFDSANYNVGDQLTLSARHSGSNASLIFKIN